MKVTLYHNENRGHFVDGYLPRHAVTEVFTFDLPDGTDPIQAADIAFQVGNIDPEGAEPGARRDLVIAYRRQEVRSLSIGDVVRVDDTWLAVGRLVGFVELAAPPAEYVKLTLTNRDHVIAFINGEFHQAHEPVDPGSDVVIVDLIGREPAVVVLGETVVRTHEDFTIGHGIGENRTVRDRFLRLVDQP